MSAVQLAPRVVDAVALAKRVQVVALPRMHGAGKCERIEHTAERCDCLRPALDSGELGIEERDVKRGVVDN